MTAKRSNDRKRKTGINKGKKGSVVNVNGMIRLDFRYLGERVREPTKLVYTPEVARAVRIRLDNMMMKIKSGDFRFAKSFPESKRAGYFAEKEVAKLNHRLSPETTRCGEFIDYWFELKASTGKVTGRTLLGYKSHIDLYIKPFFAEKTFSQINKLTMDEFARWARERCYRDKQVSNNTINKIMVPLRMICKDAAVRYGWEKSFDPFYNYQKLPKTDPYRDIRPFTNAEQKRIIKSLPAFWRPYFKFAFLTGLRQGEQMAIKPNDIQWQRRLLSIERAFTLDADGKTIEGATKNKFSRRPLHMNLSMMKALLSQRKIHDRFKETYFFCTNSGCRICPNNLRDRVWRPTLKKAKVPYRSMKQTRHSFATHNLSKGKDPLAIGRFMGHRDASMVLKTYAKHIGESKGISL